MSWRIDIPYRDRDDSLADTLASVGHTADAVARRMMLDAIGSSATVGDFLTRLEQASPEERRRLYNEAREAAGLRSVEAEEARREMEARSRGLAARGVPKRDAGGRTLAFCAHKDCGNFPLSDGGAHQLTKARRWWCEAHRHLAEDGDMDDWNPGIRFGPSGGIEFAADVEREREQALRDEERARARSERRRQERESEAEEHRAFQEAMAEHYRSKGRGWDYQ